MLLFVRAIFPGLPEVKPALRLFAQSTAALRAADWNGLAQPDENEDPADHPDRGA